MNCMSKVINKSNGLLQLSQFFIAKHCLLLVPGVDSQLPLAPLSSTVQRFNLWILLPWKGYSIYTFFIFIFIFPAFVFIWWKNIVYTFHVFFFFVFFAHFHVEKINLYNFFFLLQSLSLSCSGYLFIYSFTFRFQCKEINHRCRTVSDPVYTSFLRHLSANWKWYCRKER